MLHNPVLNLKVSDEDAEKIKLAESRLNNLSHDTDVQRDILITIKRDTIQSEKDKQFVLQEIDSLNQTKVSLKSDIDLLTNEIDIAKKTLVTVIETSRIAEKDNADKSSNLEIKQSDLDSLQKSLHYRETELIVREQNIDKLEKELGSKKDILTELLQKI